MKRTQIEVNGRAFVKVEMTADEYAAAYDDWSMVGNVIWLETEDEDVSDMLIEDLGGVYSVVYSGRGFVKEVTELEQALELVSQYM